MLNAELVDSDHSCHHPQEQGELDQKGDEAKEVPASVRTSLHTERSGTPNPAQKEVSIEVSF